MADAIELINSASSGDAFDDHVDRFGDQRPRLLVDLRRAPIGIRDVVQGGFDRAGEAAPFLRERDQRASPRQRIR